MTTKTVKIDYDLVKEFINSQREKENQDSYALNDEGAILYRFIGDCGCWELMRRRREAKEKKLKKFA